jgi:predicted alternative tryptophan synthase beta-subunit
VCGVVVEEVSREVEVTGSNHGNRGASRLYAKKCATCKVMTGTGGWLAGQWGLSYKKSFFCLF